MSLEKLTVLSHISQLVVKCSTHSTQCVFSEAFPREYYCLNTADFLMKLGSQNGLVWNVIQ